MIQDVHTAPIKVLAAAQPRPPRPAAAALASLVPVHIVIEHSSRVLDEHVLWDPATENSDAVEAFARQLLAEASFPDHYTPLVVDMIGEAVERHKPFNPDPAFGEIRVPLSIDIEIDSVAVRDQIEWDLNNPENRDAIVPFANALAAELGLPAHFGVAIATVMREQIYAREAQIMSGQLDQLSRVSLPPVDVSRVVRDPSGADVWYPDVSFAVPDETETERQMAAIPALRTIRDTVEHAATAIGSAPLPPPKRPRSASDPAPPPPAKRAKPLPPPPGFAPFAAERREPLLTLGDFGSLHPDTVTATLRAMWDGLTPDEQAPYVAADDDAPGSAAPSPSAAAAADDDDDNDDVAPVGEGRPQYAELLAGLRTAVFWRDSPRGLVAYLSLDEWQTKVFAKCELSRGAVHACMDRINVDHDIASLAELAWAKSQGIVPLSALAADIVPGAAVVQVLAMTDKHTHAQQLSYALALLRPPPSASPLASALAAVYVPPPLPVLAPPRRRS